MFMVVVMLLICSVLHCLYSVGNKITTTTTTTTILTFCVCAQPIRDGVTLLRRLSLTGRIHRMIPADLCNHSVVKKNQRKRKYIPKTIQYVQYV